MKTKGYSLSLYEIKLQVYEIIKIYGKKPINHYG